MGRKSDYLSSGKTIAANTTTSFTPSDIPGSGVLAYHLRWTGANTLAMIDRIRVKANGVTFYDCTIAQLRAMIQNATGGAVRYPAGNIISAMGAAGTAVNWRRLSIPFLILDRDLAPSIEQQDVCQFPVGSQPQLEIVWGGTAVAGTVLCGWTETDQEATCFPRFYGVPMNIPASAPVAKYAFVEDGLIRGFTVETTGLGRFRAVLAGEQLINSEGQSDTTSTTVTEDSMLHEMQQLFGEGTPAIAAGTTAVDNSCDDPRYVQLGKAMPAAAGRSFIELQTGTAWSGVASELGIHAIVPY